MSIFNRSKMTTFMVTKPYFPETVLQFDPIIYFTQVSGIKGSYRPKTGEVTIQFQNDEPHTTYLQNDRLDIEVVPSSRGKVEYLLRHWMLDEQRLFQTFIKQETKTRGLTIAQKLMISAPGFETSDTTCFVSLGLDKIPEGYAQFKDYTFIRKGNEYTIITKGYFLRLHKSMEYGVTKYTVTASAMLVRDEQTYQECYEVGQFLQHISEQKGMTNVFNS